MRKSTVITSDNCTNKNLKSLIDKLNNKKTLDFLKKINLIPNENRFLALNVSKEYDIINFIGIYNYALENLELIENTKETEKLLLESLEINCFRIFKNLDSNYLELYKRLIKKSENFKLKVCVDKKIHEIVFNSSNAVIKNKKNLKAIRNSYKEKSISNKLFYCNKELIKLVYLDIFLQNFLVSLVGNNFIVLSKENKKLIKLKKINANIISLEKKEYNSPLMPVSF